MIVAVRIASQQDEFALADRDRRRARTHRSPPRTVLALIGRRALDAHVDRAARCDA